MKQVIGILVLLTLAGAAYFLFAQSGGNVSLIAMTDKGTYASGEQVKLTLELANAGKGAVCLSQTPKGTVQFLSVTRDGEPVASRTSRSYYIAPLPLLMQAELVEVAADRSMTISLASAEDPGLGAEALSATAVDGSAGKTAFYDISKPGTYAVRVAYRHDGKPSDACKNVFTKMTNTADVSFTVTP